MSAATLIYLAGMCDSFSAALILICSVGAIATGISVFVYFERAGTRIRKENTSEGVASMAVGSADPDSGPLAAQGDALRHVHR